MTDRQVTAALAGSAAAAAAVAAPIDAALHWSTAPPWHWVVRTDSLDLYADPDPDGDDTSVLIRGGGAVHHARIALAADGLAARVRLLPDDDPHHLATITPAGRIAVTAEATALFEATELPGLREPPTIAVNDLVRAAAGSGLALTVAVRGAAAQGKLVGVEPGRRGWLRAGEGLSAVALVAKRHGLSVRVEPEPAIAPTPELILRIAPLTEAALPNRSA